MIKLRYAILGSIIPMMLVAHYSNKIIDDLWGRIHTMHENGYCECLELQEFDVTVTTYNPTKYQTDSTPNELADGTIIKPWKATQYRYVALSRDLIARWGGPFEYGDYVVIEGTDGWDGIYQVRDTMNAKWVKRVDILTTNSRFKYTNVTMYKYVKSNNSVAGNS